MKKICSMDSMYPDGICAYASRCNRDCGGSPRSFPYAGRYVRQFSISLRGSITERGFRNSLVIFPQWMP